MVWTIGPWHETEVDMPGENAVQEEKQRWRESPLRTLLGRRLLGWFLLLALVPLLASIIIGFLRSHRIMEEVLEQSLGAVTEVQVRHVRNRGDRYLAFLRAVAVGNEFLASGARAAGEDMVSGMEVAATGGTVRAYLQRQLSELPDFTDLSLLDLGGGLVASTTPLAWSKGNPTELEIPQPVKILRSATGSEPPGLRFAVPVTGIMGAHVGFLVGIVEPARLSTFFQIPGHVAGDIESFILEENWHPLHVSHAHGPVDYSKPMETPLRGMPFGTTARYRDRRGVRVVGKAARISEYSWIYLTEQPDTHALGALRRLRQASIYLALAFALLVVGAAWFVSGGIVAPVHRLVEAARRLGAGDLEARVDPVTRDEIGVLSTAFNEMAAELARSASQVRDLHQREIERAGQLASVGELAAGIAHEIKNPLAGASSGLDLLDRKLDQNLPTDNLRTQIRSQLRRMDRAVRDLLSYARPKEPRVGFVAPELLVERVVRLIRPQAEAAGVRIEQKTTTVSERIRVDPELLTQALVNLALNGVQAMDSGGVLSIGTETRDGEILIRISDTGKGIAASEIEEIFRPFFTAKHRGTGLGLAITRTIVERHGGRLEVESTPGVGSRFTLILSTVEEESEA
jgi:signal transduction histidine kinase